jgi:hypothetical protein
VKPKLISGVVWDGGRSGEVRRRRRHRSALKSKSTRKRETRPSWSASRGTAAEPDHVNQVQVQTLNLNEPGSRRDKARNAVGGPTEDTSARAAPEGPNRWVKAWVSCKIAGDDAHRVQ